MIADVCNGLLASPHRQSAGTSMQAIRIGQVSGLHAQAFLNRVPECQTVGVSAGALLTRLLTAALDDAGHAWTH